MIWIKSVIVGMAAAFVTVIAVAAGIFAMASWHINLGEGSGGIGVVHVGVFTPLVFLPAILAFTVGFWWSMRRQRKMCRLPSA
jgi:hypothetical protein